MKTNIVSIINQKGGVAKTTTAVNLSSSLAAMGMKVLVLDLDSQGNLSTSFGIESINRTANMYTVMTGNTKMEDAIQNTCIPNLDMIPANIDLSALQVEIINYNKREFILRNILEKTKLEYDFIILDCPPSLCLLSINSLVASNKVIIPVQPEFLSLEGLSHLMQTIKIIQSNYNKNLSILGVLLAMYDKRNRMSEMVANDIMDHLPKIVFKTRIPRNVRISEAPSHGKPVTIYDPKSSGALSYFSLAHEIMEILQNH